MSVCRHPARRRMCLLYIAGLIGPGDRKSVQPMAARSGDFGYDQLRHFVAAGVWDSILLEAALLRRRITWSVTGLTSWSSTTPRSRKKGSIRSASRHNMLPCSVSHPSASRWFRRRFPRARMLVMVGLRLCLPESWTEDTERMTRARVPLERQKALTNPAIAIEKIERVIASGARFGCVLADAGYGSSRSFRQALNERGLLRRSGYHDARTSTRLMLAWSFRSPRPAGVASTLCPIGRKSLPR